MSRRALPRASSEQIRASLILGLVLGVLAATLTPEQSAFAADSAPATQGPYTLRWILDPADTNRVVVEVAGFTDAQGQALRTSNWSLSQWQRLLSVFVEQGDVSSELDLPAMLGAYTVRSNRLWFVPAFPPDPGVRYRAVLRASYLPVPSPSGPAPPWITALFALPAKSTEPTTVVRQVYPSSDALPENLLKFYVHFSASMRRGHSYEHIHLRNSSGQDIELPFLELDEELWNPDMTRLTLFIDPGRIKRGVRPLEEIGPSLESGKRYTLAIDREWADAGGNPLREPFEKRFQVSEPDRTPPDVSQWKLKPPQAQTRSPLCVAFPEPMDHALALRVILVTRSSGELLRGQTELWDQERQWRFTPDVAWKPGPYHLVVQTLIEDLAGNNIGKPFEVDLVSGAQRRLTNATVKLAFEVP